MKESKIVLHLSYIGKANPPEEEGGKKKIKINN